MKMEIETQIKIRRRKNFIEDEYKTAEEEKGIEEEKDIKEEEF